MTGVRFRTSGVGRLLEHHPLGVAQIRRHFREYLEKVVADQFLQRPPGLGEKLIIDVDEEEVHSTAIPVGLILKISWKSMSCASTSPGYPWPPVRRRCCHEAPRRHPRPERPATLSTLPPTAGQIQVT
jgi:hypothetical protein